MVELQKTNILPKLQLPLSKITKKDSNGQSDITETNGKEIKHVIGKFFSGRRDKISQIFSGKFPDVGKSCPLLLNRDMWDYIIVLNNPDYSENGNREITEEYAKQFYRSVFRKKNEVNLHTENMNFEQENRAFAQIFNELSSFKEGKKFKCGGRLQSEEDGVLDKGPVTLDFMTLVRNAMIYKLVGNLGLKVKQVMSISGKYIFLLIAADLADLEIEAERIRYSKQLEISQVDLISLMPCDKALRPLYVLKPPNDKIQELIKSVRRFYRKVFKYNKEAEKYMFGYEPVGMTEAHWELYEKFLNLMASGIKGLKSSVKDHNKRLVMFQKLLKKSIEKTNNGIPKKLRLSNLWERLGFSKEIPPYLEYKKFSGDSEFRDIWRKYSINPDGERNVFTNMERIRLLTSCIDTLIDLELLEQQGIVAGHFPLHNKWELDGKQKVESNEFSIENHLMHNFLINLKESNKDLPLFERWKVSLFYNNLPLQKIRNYFGEKIAIYFEFLRMVHFYLVFPSILGIVVFALQHVYNDDRKIVVITFNIIYSIYITFWATIFVEQWKRRESSLAVLWGQTKYEQIQEPRGRFWGEPRRSPITDDLDEVHFKFSKRMKIYLISVTVTSFIIILVLSCVASFIILKTRHNEQYILYLASLGNAIQIQFFNFIYSKLAIYLTEKENHKTRIEHEDSLIVKTFCFQFVNSFNSLFYIAFIKPYTVGCDVSGGESNPSCMNELFIQLLIIFLVSYAKNLVELGLPYLKFLLKKKSSKNTENDSENDLRAEIESELSKDYYLNSSLDGTLNDYLELAILFGMLTLFAIAFPLSPILALVGLWLEMYTDKYKICKLVKRPVPLAAKDVGTWQGIFEFMSMLSIFSNTGLFCFTAHSFSDTENTVKFIVFGIVVVLLLVFRAQLQWWIPDVQEKYEIIMARHDFIVGRIMQTGKVEKIEEEIEAYDENLYFTKSQDIIR